LIADPLRTTSAGGGHVVSIPNSSAFYDDGGVIARLRARSERRRAARRESLRAAKTAAATGTVAPGVLVRLLSLRRVQLTGGLVVGVLLPAMARFRLDWLQWLPSPDHLASGNPGGSNALAACVLALLLGFVTWRQMRAHPGAVSGGYVLYAFAMTYGVLGAAFLVLRADCSRYQIFASFILTTAWFVAVDQVTRRKAVLRLAFIPGLRKAELPAGGGVAWTRLDQPRMPGPGMAGVVADLRAEQPARWERFLARCALEGVPVYDVRQIAEILTGKVKVEHLSENTLSSTLARLVYVRAKRVVDIVLVILAAPVFAPVIGLAAALVRLESPGPALFAQTRMGHRGRPFTIWKLRSMHAAAAGDRFTRENDERVTRIGAVIRKYRIDEFPQIWNILKGEMSWIGPRPEAVELADWYEREVPFYCYRHMVRPGITGWAQVNQGNVAQVDAAREKLQYDFYYIKNISPWLDLLIGAKTLWTVLTGFGSR
jgi:lipopolysaccharide/colanic/teichoic acid biosynthesis glycosyltransferase